MLTDNEFLARFEAPSLPHRRTRVFSHPSAFLLKRLPLFASDHESRVSWPKLAVFRL